MVSSHTRTLAIAASLTERLKYSGLSISCLHKIGRLERYLLNLVNAALHSEIQSKVLSFFRRKKKGRAFQADVAINLERDAILPVRC